MHQSGLLDLGIQRRFCEKVAEEALDVQCEKKRNSNKDDIHLGSDCIVNLHKFGLDLTLEFSTLLSQEFGVKLHSRQTTQVVQQTAQSS